MSDLVIYLWREHEQFGMNCANCSFKMSTLLNRVLIRRDFKIRKNLLYSTPVTQLKEIDLTSNVHFF